MLSRRAAGFLAAFLATIGTLGVTPLSAHLLTTATPDGRIVTEEHVDPARIPARTAVPGLDGPLNNLLAASRNGTLPPTDTTARVAGVRVVENTVQVMVEALDPAATDPVRAAIAAVGGTLEVEYQGLLQATVPVGALERLPAAPGVRLVRSPYHPQASAIVNEGLASMELGPWYDNGLRGAGAKLAVLDLGFDGYWNVLGTELPSNAVIRSFRADGDISGSSDTHGTAAAEVVYDVAPEALLYLVNFSTEAEMGAAVDWLASEGVNVISSSVGWPGTAYGDGKGSVNAIVARAERAGITWVQAAGNYGNTHWSGFFNDPEGNGFHNFSGADEGNTIHLRRTSPSDERVFRVEIYLTWDDWDTLSQDYDLFLFRGEAVVAQSTAFQNGQFPPVEHIVYTTASPGDYWIGVQRFRANRRSRLDLVVTTDYDLEYKQPAESLVIPADSASALTVGAVAPGTLNVRPYSSRGPTKDGRPKPELVAADQISTYITGPGGFSGTSASAPQVAGAAALYMGARPGSSPARVRSFLTSRALGGGAGNTIVGFGQVRLGELPPSAMLPFAPRGAIIGTRP